MSGILDSGENCMMHDDGATCPNCWQCNLDLVRTNEPGSCVGAKGQPGMSMVFRIQNFSGPGYHGSLCCL